MTKKQPEFPLPPNWQVSAIARAAKEKGKSYSQFIAEDLQANDALKENIFKKFTESYQKMKLEEHIRCSVKPKRKKKSSSKKGKTKKAGSV